MRDGASAGICCWFSVYLVRLRITWIHQGHSGNRNSIARELRIICIWRRSIRVTLHEHRKLSKVFFFRWGLFAHSDIIGICKVLMRHCPSGANLCYNFRMRLIFCLFNLIWNDIYWATQNETYIFTFNLALKLGGYSNVPTFALKTI